MTSLDTKKVRRRQTKTANKHIKCMSTTDFYIIKPRFYIKSVAKIKVGGGDSLEVFFETTLILKETVDKYLKGNYQSISVMMILTIKKLIEYAELD